MQLERLAQGKAETLAIGIGVNRGHRGAHQLGHGIGIERGLAVEAEGEHAAVAGGGDMAIGREGKAEAAKAVLAGGADRVGGIGGPANKGQGGSKQRRPHQALAGNFTRQAGFPLRGFSMGWRR